MLVDWLVGWLVWLLFQFSLIFLFIIRLILVLIIKIQCYYDVSCQHSNDRYSHHNAPTFSTVARHLQLALLTVITHPRPFQKLGHSRMRSSALGINDYMTTPILTSVKRYRLNWCENNGLSSLIRLISQFQFQFQPKMASRRPERPIRAPPRLSAVSQRLPSKQCQYLPG